MSAAADPIALRSPAVAAVLARLRAEGREHDAPGKHRVRERERQLSEPVYGLERAELYGTAPLAISDEVGELLWMLTLTRRPDFVVEFGGSLGVSTIYLASALRDLGGGRLITTELVPAKAALLVSNLSEAGLADTDAGTGTDVEVRVGDALQTLAELPHPVDLLFLDGSNDLYLPLLQQLQPHLAPQALVVADLSAGDPHHVRYVAHVTDPASGYRTIQLPLDAGVVVSVRPKERQPSGPSRPTRR